MQVLKDQLQSEPLLHADVMENAKKIILAAPSSQPVFQIDAQSGLEITPPTKAELEQPKEVGKNAYQVWPNVVPAIPACLLPKNRAKQRKRGRIQKASRKANRK